MKTWYELWSKAGASPSYRVENIDIYLSGKKQHEENIVCFDIE